MLELHGEFDLANTAIVRDAIEHSLHRDDQQRLVIDMHHVTFMDARGLGVLLEGVRSGLTITIRWPSRIVRRLLDASGTDHFFTVEDR